jgi:ATP adenylyltransferase
MDHLFTPWRYAYVTARKPDAVCVLCRIGTEAPSDDEGAFVLHRALHHFLVLNIYPYNTGHLMIVPYAHAARLSDLHPEALGEMFDLAARAEKALEDAYRPEGINLGMNLGACAGAGIADHLHLHLVPRWSADTNFMTVSGETRVLPEDLATTWRKLRGRL